MNDTEALSLTLTNVQAAVARNQALINQAEHITRPRRSKVVAWFTGCVLVGAVLGVGTSTVQAALQTTAGVIVSQDTQAEPAVSPVLSDPEPVSEPVTAPEPTSTPKARQKRTQEAATVTPKPKPQAPPVTPVSESKAQDKATEPPAEDQETPTTPPAEVTEPPADEPEESVAPILTPRNPHRPDPDTTPTDNDLPETTVTLPSVAEPEIQD